jgi:hypothetical protein
VIEQEMTMLKTISAALLAVSMLAAPAMAAGFAKTTAVPTTKSATFHGKHLNSHVLRAQAHMKHGKKHHVRHYHHHRHHAASKMHINHVHRH